MTPGPRNPRHAERAPAWVVGAIMVVVLAILAYLAFAKELPFGDDGYELTATFDNAATIRTDAPVRIAGVNVGKVTAVESKGDAVAVSFTVDDEGQPVHDDAEITIRPRLFLEGNFFLDLRPGSPSAAELPDDGEVPITRTSVAVQLDEVLTSLQSDSRRDLQRLLEGYGTTLTYQPTAADDSTQDPDVHGETAAEALNDTFEYGGPAGKNTAIVLDALRGREPHDLSKLIGASRDVFTKLESHESELQGLISNFNVTTGALAAESSNVSASLRELAPTLEEGEPSLRHLSDALPPLRAWARELEPSLRELPGTIEAAGPWIDQTTLLLRDAELGNLAKLLGAAARPLARTADEATRLLPELTALSRCTTDVLDPASDTVITVDPNDPGNPSSVWQEFFYGAVNLAGSTGNFDGNGHYLRAQAGGGDVLVSSPNPGGSFGNTENLGTIQDDAAFPARGVQPALPASAPPFRTDVACHTNAPPSLNGPVADPQPPDMEVVP
jgi:phospholipid/cholesterol/gamma-HCH transport system substrate-binding protein